MALPIKKNNLNEIAQLDVFYNGGKGSGNFGHSGRPGEVGGVVGQVVRASRHLKRSARTWRSV